MAIGAGELRNRVTVKRRATPQDSAGERALGWVRVREVWASVEPQPGGGPPTAGTPTATTLFRFRYLADLSPANRLVWNGRVFDVVSVADVEGRREETLANAKELVGVIP